jgi:hypothetical protein
MSEGLLLGRLSILELHVLLGIKGDGAYAGESPYFFPELGEAVNGPIIQSLIGVEILAVLLVDDLKELPQGTACRMLVFPERGITGLGVSHDFEGEGEGNTIYI